ncbi:MAG: cytochrome C oxidase subunit IV family protein [Bryobacterales bacterium]|nr:cytochrome C oxidase subunit IV family protein [Bryobacterales bacterium]
MSTNHVVPAKTYVYIFLALIGLTLATTEIAKVDLGWANTPVAFLIAGSKTLLVVLFFMHMKWSSYKMKVVAASGLVWLVLLFAFTVGDYATRDWIAVPGPWPQHPPASAAFDSSHPASVPSPPVAEHQP